MLPYIMMIFVFACLVMIALPGVKPLNKSINHKK